MSDREVSGTTGDGDAKEIANYTLELELGERVAPGCGYKETIDGVRNYRLRSGFLVIECEGGERWLRASDVAGLHKKH